MSKFKALTILLYLCSVLYFSCQKDSDDGNTPAPIGIWGGSTRINIIGQVIDENGNAVSGAQVNAGGSLTTTNVMGVFVLNGVSAFENLGYVKVEKAGYFPGSRSFVPGSSTELVEIRLLTKTHAGTVSGSTGGTVYADGVSVELAPGSVVKSNNSVHTGKVRVYVSNIDPTSPDFNQEMPGNLIAVQDNQPRGLTSFGMVAIELISGGGLPLKLAQGQTATVKFPIAQGLQASAPASIDLWSFDEENGYWKHEGQATRSGNEYIAEVSHFSFWNCDVPWDYILIDGLVKVTNNQPMPNATVTITGTNVGSANDITNSQGEFGGYVPVNEVLSISVSCDCAGTDTTVYAANIGPFTSNTTLSQIMINSQGFTIVTGTVVDCNNAALANSYVLANGQVYYAPNGQFRFQACGSSVSITPYGTSPWVPGIAQILTLSGGTVSAGALQVCATGGGGGSCVGGPSTVTDIDGNVYNVVTIGNQCWMQENLKVSNYRNGDPITTNLSGLEWETTTSGAFAFHNNAVSNDSIYGKLYNWYAVADPRGLCPTGWHEPTDSEWNVLIKTLDPQADTASSTFSQSLLAGGFMKSTGTLQAGTGLWNSPNSGATNSSGFTGFPGGSRSYSGGTFYNIGTHGFWWSSTQHSSVSSAWYRFLDFSNDNVYWYFTKKKAGFSVRCVRD